jgi:ABC-type uncharacterized transport system auxiliary subunit
VRRSQRADVGPRAWGWLIGAAWWILVAGCGAVADSPARQSFLIHLDSAAGQDRAEDRTAHKPLGAVYFSPVTVAAPFSERNLVVRRSEVGYAVDPYAEFAASPVSMWTDVLRSWLERQQLFERVLPIDSSAEADLTLETNLLEAVADRREGRPPSSRLVVRFLLVQNHAPYQVLLDHTFTHEEAVKGSGAESEVAALSLAAKDVLRDFEVALSQAAN